MRLFGRMEDEVDAVCLHLIPHLSSTRQPASVHGEDVAVDVVARRGGEEDGRAGQV
jgi:hypothetical protein